MSLSRTQIIGGLVVVGLIAAGVILFWPGSDDGDGVARGDEPLAPARGENALAAFEGGPPTLLYLGGTTLYRTDLGDLQEKRVADLDSTAVAAAPGAEWIAFVTVGEAGPADEPEPFLEVMDARTKDRKQLGLGVTPLFSPLGNGLAYVRPRNLDGCTALFCPGAREVMLADPATGESDLLLEAGDWDLVMWAGQRLLVADRGSGDVYSLTRDGDRARLDVDRVDLLAASPDGRWLTLVERTRRRGTKVRFVSFEDGRLGEASDPVNFGPRRVGEAAWAPDSTRMALVVTDSVITGRKKAREVSELVMLVPDEPEPQPVPNTDFASSQLLWAPERDTITFATIAGRKPLLLQALNCPLGPEGNCATLFTWQEGVTMLRME